MARTAAVSPLTPDRLRVASTAALALVAAAAVTTAAGPWSAQSGDASSSLQPGIAVERGISGSRTDVYLVRLAQGQYARVVAAQSGIDVAMRLVGADGEIAIETEPIGGDSEEVLELVAPAAATFQIQLQPRYPRMPAGRYQIRIAEVRSATDRDQLLFEARSWHSHALKQFQSGEYDRARRHAERALDTREAVLGLEHPAVAACLTLLGAIESADGDFVRADALYMRALAIVEKAFGSDRAAVAGVLDYLAENAALAGHFADAERAALRAISIREQRLGVDHVLVARSLRALTDVYLEKSDVARSAAASDRALEIARQTYAPDDLPLTDFLHRAARVQLLRGEFSRAEATMTESLRTRERVAGAGSFSASDALALLAFVHLRKGEDVRSEELYRQAVAIKERILGPDHLQIANILNNTGLLAYRRRDYRTAEERHLRSLTIKEKTLGPDHLLVAYSLNNLGLVYWRLKEPQKAKDFFARTLALSEKWYGPDADELAPSLGNLGILSKETGDYDRAETYYRRALTIREKALGPHHPDLVVGIESLGILARDRGEYAAAEPFFLRSLAISERSLGPDHPTTARQLSNLAHLYAAGGSVAKALESLQRVAAIEEKNLPLNLAAGSERQRLAYFTPFHGSLERIIAFHVDQAPASQTARDLAATALLQRKARVLDAMADTLGTLRGRASGEGRSRFDELNVVTSQLAALVLGGPQRLSITEHQQQIARLIGQRETLEAEISRQSTGFYKPTAAVTLDAVRAAIPIDAALVEFWVSRPYDPKASLESPDRFGAPRYVAYIISRHHEVRWKDLGSASEIDAAVDAMREALRTPAQANVKRLARALDEKVMQPIRALTGDARRLLISPDGQLALIPFEALTDEAGRYLVERYSISYLTAGRDLVRMQVARHSNSPPVIVADPLFGDPAPTQGMSAAAPQRQDVSGRNSRRSVTAGTDLETMYFAPLAGTEQEARSIQAFLPGAQVLTKLRATEQAIKNVDAPQILHIATHGFFLQTPRVTSGPAPAPQAEGTRAIQSSAQIENPLLRSGLAVTGANSSRGASEDGILTALEASHLNLWGTKLVTLSACDTGVGVVSHGDGVYGLRRSIFLAGAESLLMSLWPVSDYVTREMMTGYYKGLTEGGLGRGEALRSVQLSMLKRRGREHPFYWASFIHAGEWASLDGRR